MKNVNVILTLVAVILSGFVFHSCQKDDVALRGEKKVMGVSGPLSWNEPCPGDDLVLTLGETGNRQIQILENGVWIQFAQVASGSNPLVGTLEDVEVGTYYFRYKIGTGGGFTDVNITIEPCCIPGFTYVDNGDGTYTFTYTPEEDLTDAEVVFTFAQGVAVSGLDGSWSGSGVTRQNTLDFVACSPVSWTVTLAANCSGNSGASNVWTDFKVNGVSLKADPEVKFVQYCN